VCLQAERGKEIYGLFQYEKILDRIEKYIIAISEHVNKSKFSIVEEHDLLPKLAVEALYPRYSARTPVYPVGDST
jgi:hypothetical protein